MFQEIKSEKIIYKPTLWPDIFILTTIKPLHPVLRIVDGDFISYQSITSFNGLT